MADKKPVVKESITPHPRISNITGVRDKRTFMSTPLYPHLNTGDLLHEVAKKLELYIKEQKQKEIEDFFIRYPNLKVENLLHEKPEMLELYFDEQRKKKIEEATYDILVTYPRRETDNLLRQVVKQLEPFAEEQKKMEFVHEMFEFFARSMWVTHNKLQRINPRKSYSV